MKRVVLSIALLLASCDVTPPIGPDLIDASTGASSSSSAASSASSSASSSSSSSGGLQGDGSGTRLKRYVYTSADGLVAERINPFYDAQLGIDCSPQSTKAGTRCMPAQATPFAGWFADPQCTIDTTYVVKQCDAPKYANKYVAAACSAILTAEYFAVVQTPAQAVYIKDGPNCNDVSASVLQVYDVYAIGSEVDYTQFATMTLEHE